MLVVDSADFVGLMEYANNREYTVQFDNEQFSLNVELEEHTTFASQLQLLHTILLHQHPSCNFPASSEYVWGFQHHEKWCKLTTPKQLLAAKCLGIFSNEEHLQEVDDENILNGNLEEEREYQFDNTEDNFNWDYDKSIVSSTANCDRSWTNPYSIQYSIFRSYPFFFESVLPFYFCKLLVSGGELWAERGMVMERLYVSHSTRCKYKWCNMLLGRDETGTSGPGLVLRGVDFPILAIYCSAQCAMLDRQELLSHTQKSAGRSFRFLVHRKSEEVRLLRLLREVHEDLTQRMRVEAGIAQCLSLERDQTQETPDEQRCKDCQQDLTQALKMPAVCAREDPELQLMWIR
eukprot:Phypoly_transcript_11170.p1 GENE.Phypoly_transcript_11170~~Phypoly_transcript_11170.p1  ORF type:complete len:348 (+),score=30.49 Phypoly_transcript_11170:129-1172(+)